MMYLSACISLLLTRTLYYYYFFIYLENSVNDNKKE